jgi:histidyl-tRNA synthetase
MGRSTTMIKNKIHNMQKNKDIVFISYARDDEKQATNLYKELTKHGINAWLDTKNIKPGENWKVCISSAVKKSRWFIALLSDNSVNKVGYIQKELKLAFDVLDEYPEQEIYLIPVRLDNCKPTSERIYDLNWVDLFRKRLINLRPYSLYQFGA